MFFDNESNRKVGDSVSMKTATPRFAICLFLHTDIIPSRARARVLRDPLGVDIRVIVARYRAGPFAARSLGVSERPPEEHRLYQRHGGHQNAILERRQRDRDETNNIGQDHDDREAGQIGGLVCIRSIAANENDRQLDEEHVHHLRVRVISFECDTEVRQQGNQTGNAN